MPAEIEQVVVDQADVAEVAVPAVADFVLLEELQDAALIQEIMKTNIMMIMIMTMTLIILAVHHHEDMDLKMILTMIMLLMDEWEVVVLGEVTPVIQLPLSLIQHLVVVVVEEEVVVVEVAAQGMVVLNKVLWVVLMDTDPTLLPEGTAVNLVDMERQLDIRQYFVSEL